jgi:eukaryotic-like serine/threonine-protein kinase
VLTPGVLIRDTYEVEVYLGAGAYGDVYRVRHRFLGVQALKLVEVGPDAPPVDELLQEARVLATLTDSHVVRLFDADVCELEGMTFPYLTMEFVRHGTLGQLQSRRIRFEVSEALECAQQMLLGLQAAHSLMPPVLHRDLTPGNVLVAELEPLTLKLSDFGLAAHVHPDTRLLRAAGTIRYQPPEAAWGYATESSDLYAVALILYELLTGVPAFALGAGADLRTSVGVAEALRSSRETEPAPPSSFRAGLPQAVDELVVAALAPKPEDRFRSAREFANTIASVSHRQGW